jgi:hypothetical protein
MTSSLIISIGLLVLRKNGVVISTDVALMITVAFTTVCWLIAAYAAPETDRRVLGTFYTKVRPFGPGWARVRRDLGLQADDPSAAGQVPLALVGWVSGCAMIWSSLFTIGCALYGRWTAATGLFAVFVLSGVVLLGVVRRLWATTPSTATT